MSPLHRLRHTRLAFLAVFAAMLLRGLVPAGYMLGGNGPNGVTVMLCTMDGLKQVTLPSDPLAPKGDDGSGERQHATAPCAFGMLGAPGATGRAAPLPLLASVRPQWQIEASIVAPATPSILRSQSSRGPPPIA